MNDIIVALNEGEILVPKSDSVWKRNFKEIRLINKTTLKGEEYWWCEMTATGGSSHLDTMSLKTLRASWQRKGRFFKVGKTYKFPQGISTYKVLDVYAVDNPTFSGAAAAAVALLEFDSGYPKGTQEITILNLNDFGKMVEA